MTWDEYFEGLLGPVAAKSKDRSRRIGCVIVGDANQILTAGFNGLPRGADDDNPARHERPEKYFWFEHAERNAIYNAARHGIKLEGATLYVNLFPCMDCARAIAQSGIQRVVSPAPDLNDPTFGKQFMRALRLFSECGVHTTYAGGADDAADCGDLFGNDS